jgi:hypothetical protein
MGCSKGKIKDRAFGRARQGDENIKKTPHHVALHNRKMRLFRSFSQNTL